MRIVALSDSHGRLVEIPSGDLLVIAGDLCPVHNHDVSFQCNWLVTNFAEWARQTPVCKILLVAGNHCFWAEQSPTVIDELERRVPKLVYLEDSGYEYDGMKFWGCPYTVPFYDWAFMLPEEELKLKYEKIPQDTDVLISHGPPHGAGDLAYGKHLGSVSLRNRIAELVNLKHVFTGHIHPARGEYKVGHVAVHNVSLLDDHYDLVNQPLVVNLNEG